MKCRFWILVVCIVGIIWFRSIRLLIVNIHPKSSGLGNQLFMYAAAVSLAEKNPDFSVCWSSWEWFALEIHTNSFFLHHVQPAVILPECSSWTSFTGELLLPRFVPPPWKYVPFTPKAATLVNSCMESFRYFPTMKPIYSIKSSPAATQWMLKHNLTSAIHVRRTDYSSLAAPIGFYKRNHVKGRAVVVTDDPAWILQHPEVFGNHVLSEGHDPGFDMALLAAATDKVVIGIGTFAWWGAYLSNARQIVYYCHQVGYESDQYVEKDHMPERWIKDHIPTRWINHMSWHLL